MTIPRIYLPAQNINPPISPFPTHGAEILCVDLDFGTGGILGDGRRDGLYSDAAGSYEVVNGVSTYMAQNTAYASHQDGYPDGSLQTLSWDSDGVLTGGFSNGQYLGLARLGLARVQNPEGLSNQGGTTFVETANSGALFVGAPGAGGLGVIRGGTLETSNVDLPTELNYMIIAQRSFEANARTATVANEMLQTAVNLGR
jgi:flagellar hook protein FlgE